MANEFQIKGLDAVLRKMRGLAPALKRKALRPAGTKAMRPVRDAARKRAKRFDDPKSPKAVIWKAIATRYDAKASKRVGGSVTKVGVVGGARPARGREDVGHWRLKEFGTANMPADPFMRPSLPENVQLVTTIFGTSLEGDIDKFIAKGR